MTERVRISDVAARDGLQNERVRVPTPDKARLVEALMDCGVDEVEVTSFVSPKWIPQLGDAAELLELLAPVKSRAARDVCLSALVPNAQGMERLIAANERAAAVLGGEKLIDKVSVFTAASETFSRKNTNASIDETLERFVPVIASAGERGLAVRGYVSCVIACPFEGAIDAKAVAALSGRLVDLGVDELDLGDTIGAGTPESVAEMISSVMGVTGLDRITLHLHDTNGRAAACVRTALEMGVRSFDSSAGGLGGCPYASTPGRRAPGNIATSTLLDAIESAGMSTGVDRAALDRAARIAGELVAGSEAVG